MSWRHHGINSQKKLLELVSETQEKYDEMLASVKTVAETSNDFNVPLDLIEIGLKKSLQDEILQMLGTYFRTQGADPLSKELPILTVADMLETSCRAIEKHRNRLRSENPLSVDESLEIVSDLDELLNLCQAAAVALKIKK